MTANKTGNGDGDCSLSNAQGCVCVVQFIRKSEKTNVNEQRQEM